MYDIVCTKLKVHDHSIVHPHPLHTSATNLYLVIDDKIIAITECCHCAPDLDAHVLGSTYE